MTYDPDKFRTAKAAIKRYHNEQPPIVPVRLVFVREKIILQTERTAETLGYMADDARIHINVALPDNPLTRPGLRLNWPQESETK